MARPVGTTAVGLAATVPAQAMGEGRPGRHEHRWQASMWRRGSTRLHRQLGSLRTASESKGHAMARMVSTTIARPVEEVFGFFLALDENAPKTDPSAGSVVKSPEGRAGPGTTFRFRQQTLGKVRETTTRFTTVQPNRRIEFEAEIGPMRPRCDLTFEQTDGGTRVTFRGDSNPVGPLKWLNPTQP